MKKNELAEVKKMDRAALSGKVVTLREEIARLVVDKNMRKLTNLKVVKGKRRELAQVLTVLKQKELVENLEKGEVNG